MSIMEKDIRIRFRKGELELSYGYCYGAKSWIA